MYMSDIYVIKPSGGLCNYLRVIFSYYQYAQKINKKLVVIWTVTRFCNGFFLDYFEPVENIEFIKYGKNFHADIKKYKISYCGPTWHKDYPPNEYYIYDKLILLPSMQKIINERINILNNNYISVHVRHTDLNNNNNDDEYYSFINNELNDVSTNLYIASDNKNSYNKFKNDFKDRIKFNYHHKINGLRQTSLKDAIIDLYMCINSNKFKGTYFSSFSDFIIHVRNHNKKS